MSIKSWLLEKHKRYEKYEPAAFFVGGFLFDILTLSQIDSLSSIISQVCYLLLAGVLVLVFYFEEKKGIQLSNSLQIKALKRVWDFKIPVLHFIFGCLLSLYTLFFFMSSSLAVSFFFMVFMVAVFVINELSFFHQLDLQMKIGLYSLCWFCFLAYLVPIALGFIGLVPFVLSLLLTLAIMWGCGQLLIRQGLPKPVVTKDWWRPPLLIALLFLTLYVLQVIPPVPLSLKSIGIYHDIKRTAEGNYMALHERPWWKVWKIGDQDFVAQPGDRIYCLAEIFSPTTFKDRIYFHWMYKDPRFGWQDRDRIPISILGGRNQGFRGYTYKGNFDEGKWRVKVETEDGREIGRINLWVTKELDQPPRSFNQDLY